MLNGLSRRSFLAALLVAGVLGWGGAHAAVQGADPLPSWNDGPTKQSIIDFVTRVTKEGGPDYVEPAERIATIDNDGTLWVEQPIYTQFAFAIDEVKAQANQAPGVEHQGAVQVGPRRRHEGRRRAWARRAWWRSWRRPIPA